MGLLVPSPQGFARLARPLQRWVLAGTPSNGIGTNLVNGKRGLWSFH